MNDLAAFREKQRQKYLERQRNEEAKQAAITAPPPTSTTVPSACSGPSVPTTQTSPNIRTPAVVAPSVNGTVATDEEMIRRLQEEEDARYARELMDRELAANDDVRPPDTQFTERLIDNSPPALQNAYTQSLFAPDILRQPHFQPVSTAPPPVQRSDIHAWGSRTAVSHRAPMQMAPMGNRNPLAPSTYNPGDAPTLRNDPASPHRFFPPSDFGQPMTVHPPLITPHVSASARRPNFVSRSPPHSMHSGSWTSTPSPIPSDTDEDARARQLREDEAFAKRLQEEEERRR
eukprot:Gregarina_sp_Pseudo_9__3374@NODE_354_length_3082_cov_26_283273_g333_i0_p2_GENE_NODE_354_length_3082_cov_26_283273_g333_i0NODE_354_length_3082_cov_26_283273_g333_i0_p2_ORF_typecomplete_len289_score69_49CCDC50_N/PF15295_6/2_5e03CCDC50_N/PF15295_6/0_74CCDC50_N/PF15295_6/0_52_NODE_354_length_3082_cov_26_283273_g333_i06061472